MFPKKFRRDDARIVFSSLGQNFYYLSTNLLLNHGFKRLMDLTDYK